MLGCWEETGGFSRFLPIAGWWEAEKQKTAAEKRPKMLNGAGERI